MRERRPLVLCVDDDRDLAALIAEVLESEGYSAATAHDGKRALALLEQGLEPDVVITDIMMPQMDGFAFLEHYGQRPPPRAPVLAVSAFDGYLQPAREAGAEAVLAKPFSIEKLLEVVRDLAARRLPPVHGAPIPDEAAERARVDAVLALGLDSPRPQGDALQAFTERVARIFDVPICLVSIITADRQVWHASCGLPDDVAAAGSDPRQDSFCTHVVAARAALVVQDAASSPFFRNNPWVRQRGLRFYAGVPLFSRRNEAIGTLCIIDHAPHGFDYFDLELLAVLAKRVVSEIEWRERREREEAPLSAFGCLEYLDEELDVLGRSVFEDALLVESLRCAERRWPISVAVAAVPAEGLRETADRVKAAFPAGHLGRLGAARLGVAAPRSSADDVRRLLASACGPAARIEAEDVLGPGSGRVVLARLERALGETGLA